LSIWSICESVWIIGVRSSAPPERRNEPVLFGAAPMMSMSLLPERRVRTVSMYRCEICSWTILMFGLASWNGL
jgi:hypothetical protein